MLHIGSKLTLFNHRSNATFCNCNSRNSLFRLGLSNCDILVLDSYPGSTSGCRKRLCRCILPHLSDIITIWRMLWLRIVCPIKFDDLSTVCRKIGNNTFHFLIGTDLLNISDLKTIIITLWSITSPVNMKVCSRNINHCTFYITSSKFWKCVCFPVKFIKYLNPVITCSLSSWILRECNLHALHSYSISVSIARQSVIEHIPNMCFSFCICIPVFSRLITCGWCIRTIVITTFVLDRCIYSI